MTKTMFSSASDLETELKIKHKCPTAPTLHAYLSSQPSLTLGNPVSRQPASLHRLSQVAAQQVASLKEESRAWCLPPIEHTANTPHAPR